MSKSQNDEDRDTKLHNNAAKDLAKNLKKPGDRSIKSHDFAISASADVMENSEHGDEVRLAAKGEKKHTSAGRTRQKRKHSSTSNRASSDEGSVGSSSNSSSSSSDRRDKKRKRSTSSSRKRRHKQEEKRRRKSKKKKMKDRSKSKTSHDSSDNDDEINVRRSAITGRKIKMHIDKDASDLVLEKARKDFLRYVNSSF